MSSAVANAYWPAVALAALVAGAGMVAAAQVTAPDLDLELAPGGVVDPDGGGARDPVTGHTFVSAQGWGVAMRVNGSWHATCRADGLDCQPLRLTRTHDEDQGSQSVERHDGPQGPLLEVRQQYEVTPQGIIVLVTLANIGDTAAETVLYRTVWKFAVEPGTEPGPARGHQLVDIRATSPVAFTSTHGNARVSPLEDPATPSGPTDAPTYPDTCDAIDLGPGTVSQGIHVEAHGACNNGFLAEVALGALEAGAERSIRLSLAVAPTNEEVHQILRGQADSWAVTYPDPERVPEETEVRAFGIGIRPLIDPPIATFTPQASLPDPLPATWSPGAICMDHPVTFLDGSRSEVGIAHAAWDHGDGHQRALVPWTPLHDHTYSSPGAKTVTLEILDKAGRLARTQQTLHVVDCGLVPVPVLDWEVVSNTCSGWAVRFDATRSFDADGQITATRWSIAGSSHEGPTLTIEPSDPVASAKLTVTDDSGRQATAQRTALRPALSCAAQIDADADGHLDHLDNCRTVWNPLQADADHDAVGDACDVHEAVIDEEPVHQLGETLDTDADGVPDPADNCPTVPNTHQENLDLDQYGDVCDKDLDGDGIVQSDEAAYLDNCPYTHNPLQEDTDSDGIGDACRAPTNEAGAPAKIVPAEATARDALEAAKVPNWALAAIGAGAVAVVAGAPTAWRRWTPLLAVGFSRLSGTQVEEHPVRQRIVQLLNEKPGLHFHAIVREVGKGRGTVRHHLDVLTRAGLVRAHAAKGFTAFYPGGARVHNVEARTALQSPLAWRILQAACHSPGASVSELARLVGSRHGTVHHHVQRLRELGLLESQDQGRARALYPSPKGLEILSTADVARVGLE